MLFRSRYTRFTWEGSLRELAKLNKVDPIEQTDGAMMAECLGLDSNKFKSQARGADDDFDDTFGGGAFAMDDDERFADCEPLTLKTRSGEEFDFCGVRAILDGKVRVEDALAPSTPDVGKENTPVSQGKAAMFPTNSLFKSNVAFCVLIFSKAFLARVFL